jgi:hypothetical protein
VAKNQEQNGCQQLQDPSNSRKANNSMYAKIEGTPANVGKPIAERTPTSMKTQKGCHQQQDPSNSRNANHNMNARHVNIRRDTNKQ